MGLSAAGAMAVTAAVFTSAGRVLNVAAAQPQAALWPAAAHSISWSDSCKDTCGYLQVNS